MGYNNLDLSGRQQLTMSNPLQRTVLVGNTVLEEPPEQSISNPLITINGENGNFYLSDEMLSRPICFAGSTGYGKTNVMFQFTDSLVENINDDDLVVIFDARGDFENRYYHPESPKDLLISPLDEDKSKTCGWNTFGEFFDKNGGIENASSVATEISKHLFSDLEGSSQPFFQIAAADVYAAILIAMLKRARDSGDYSRLKNENFISFINSAGVKDLYELVQPYPELRRIHKYFGDGNNQQGLGVLGFVQAATQKFIGPFANSNMPGGQFSIRRIVREKKINRLFIKFDVSRTESLSIHSVLFDLLINEAISCKDRKVYLLVDEFNILKSEAMETALNFGRGSGLRTIISLQSCMPQLKKNYDEATALSMMAGFVNMICFNCADSDTREYLSRRSGKTLEAVSFGGITLTREGTTIEDSDISNLGIGEAYVSLVNTPTFKFKFKKTE